MKKLVCLPYDKYQSLLSKSDKLSSKVQSLGSASSGGGYRGVQLECASLHRHDPGLRGNESQASRETGDVVRIARFRELFTREYDEHWTHELFVVADRDTQQGIPMYVIKDYANKEIGGEILHERTH